MGFSNPFKKSRREVNRSNQSQGKEGESQIRRKYEFNGYKVERTGKGHDLKATKRDWITGKKEKPIYVEVKTGGSKLSKLQKSKKRQFGRRYVEERLEPTAFGLIKSGGMFSTRDSSRKKKPHSDYDNLFGTGSSRRKKKSVGIW